MKKIVLFMMLITLAAMSVSGCGKSSRSAGTTTATNLPAPSTSADEKVAEETAETAPADENAAEEAAETVSADENAAEETTETGAEAGDSGGVTPDFKAAMDSYEAFFDEYVAFMQKYSESDNTVAMLGDYAKMMLRYTEMSQKLDAIDEQELSAADAAYYAEVTGRITQKLLEVQ